MSRVAPPSSQDQRYVDNISDDYAFVRDRSQRLLNKKGSLPNMYNAYSQREVKDYAPTQMTSCNRASSASAVLIKKPQYRIRKLTPKECWRLMGFPDEAFEKAKSAGISNSQLYKQAGNSIVVDVLYYMFRNLFKENEKVSVNELFSGIGAQRAALDRLGIEHNVVGISEIDKYAIKSYITIYGETRNYGDISKAEKLDYADFWTYSFPCVDISVAGKQKGITKGETRSGLLYEVERLLNAAKDSNTLPKYLMLENVKNLVGKKFKPQFDEWLSYLDSMGYNTYWKVLNAKDYGIPQNRERVFAISIRKDIDNGAFEFPQPFDNGIRLKDILEDEVDEKFYITNEKADKLIEELVESGELSERGGR